MSAMSAKKCCVPHCNKSREDNVTLHVFPNPTKDPERFHVWKNTIGGPILSLENEVVFSLRRVCHLHFESKFNTWSNRLSANAVPTLNIPGVNPSWCKTYIPARLAALRSKVRSIQNSKESSTKKLHKALKLFEAPSFKDNLRKFTAVATIFTLLQFREAGKPKMGRRFEKNEKLMALAMYKQGPRMYRWLRKLFVLPSPLTLTRMIQAASIKPGINANLFNQLKNVAKKMKTNDKLCVLLFDEMALTPHFDYNRRTDIINGFVNNGCNTQKEIADHVLVFMIRGLLKNYKQPVSYTFCSKTTPKLELVAQIRTIIKKLQTIGFTVLATVCDQGSTNVSAINHLINENKENYLRSSREFKHAVFEVEGQEVIPIYDPPHLLKGIRNNLLNKDLQFTVKHNVKTAKWEHIIKLYNENPAYQGIRLMPKLTERHVLPNKIAKMKVKCAAQVFSRTVAANMGYLANHGIIPKECEDTAELLIFFDNLFDSVNGSYIKANKKLGKPLLGAVNRRSPHKKVWAEAKLILKSMKYITKNGKIGVVPSITNWLVTINNIEYLIDKLSVKYDVTSVWLRHINQDPLENFFGCIRSHGIRNTSPTCAGFEAGYASLLVNNMSKAHSPGSNCESDSCFIFKSLKNIFFKNPEPPNYSIEVDFEDVTLNHLINIDEKFKNKRIQAQLEYVTGYVLRKLKCKIFKNCEICNDCLFNKDKENTHILYREYYKNKNCLTYPDIKIIESFSFIQDTVIFILAKRCHMKCLKSYIKTVLSIIIDYEYIKCKNHKSEIINMLEDLTINLIIYSWCKTNNKLMNGNRTDYEENDVIQKKCYEYCKNKRKIKYIFVLF